MSYNPSSTGNQLKLAGTTSGNLTVKAAAATTSYSVFWPPAQAASSSYALLNDGFGNLSWGLASSGTVTSVAFADNSISPIFTVSGSPITTSGTLGIALANQSAHFVFIGPASGSAAQPTFRALLSSDIPALSYVSSVGANAPLSSTGGLTPTLSITLATTSTSGYLSSFDWNTFNNKQDALTLGNLTDAGTDGITITGGTGAVVGSGTSISQHVADSTHNGYLSSSDWSAFNGKLTSPLTTKGDILGFDTAPNRVPIGTDGWVLTADSTQLLGLKWAASAGGISALTGDVTASGSGSVAATISNSAVTNAKLANMASNTLKGNNTGSPAAPIDLTITQVLTLLGVSSFWLDPVIDDTNTPASMPSNGDRYLVGTSPTGAWSGQANKIAVWQSGAPSTGAVTWINFNNTSAVGGTLTFHTGSFSNNSATTTQSLASNGDYIEFQVNDTAQNIIVGLTHVPFSSGNGPAQTDFIMNFSQAGPIYKANNDNNYVQIAASWTLGDTFRIQINSGSVAYYQNGMLLSTDSLTPTFPLYGVGTASIPSGTASITVNYSVAGSGTWNFLTPVEGDSVHVESLGLYRYHSGNWIDPGNLNVPLKTSKGIADTSYQRVTAPGDFTINNNVSHVIVDAGTQVTLTVTMPAVPIDGQLVTISFVGSITTLSVAANSGQTLDGTPSSAAVNAFASWIYVLGTTTWYRCG